MRAPLRAGPAWRLGNGAETLEEVAEPRDRFSQNAERQVRGPASRWRVAARSAAGHFLTAAFLILDEAAAAAGAPSALTPTVKVVSVVLRAASVHAIFRV